MNKWILVIGGYANSGKSTSIEHLSKLVPVLSTSEKLYDVTADILINVLGFSYTKEEMKEILKNGKAAKILMFNSHEVPAYLDISVRDLLIMIAEKCIVNNLGRQAFSGSVINDIPEDSQIVAIESIGGEEYKHLKALAEYKGFNVLPINIRSSGELKGVDIRELLPNAKTIENDGTIEELGIKLEQITNLIKSQLSY
jgi:hypothetical protein